MDGDIFDLDDQGIPLDLDKLPGTSDSNADKSRITTEIPDDDCIVKEMTKAERNGDTDSYTDSPFLARAGTSSSSFNNGLYPTMDDGEADNELGKSFDSNLHTGKNVNYTIPGNQQTKDVALSNQIDENTAGSTDVCSTQNNKTVVEDRASSSSDDVFTNCPGCTKLANDANKHAGLYADCSKVPIEGDFSQCPDCGRLDLHLTAFDIHVTERNDSAICSTASDDSDQSQSIQSESSMAISEVYLMPESPSAEDAVNGSRKSEHDMNAFDFDLSDNNHNYSDNIYKDVKRKLMQFDNPCYAEMHKRSRENGILSEMLKKNYMDDFLVRQSRCDDIWCIAETKL